MKKAAHSIDAILEAMPQVQAAVRAEIAGRMAAGEAIDTPEEIAFKRATDVAKLQWLEERSLGSAAQQKNAA
ncbi:MAG: hypothetical protein RL367_807 [Pseudomonadota bacterium]